MEFRYGLWRGVSPLMSESGRQLGEENTRPFLFNDHLPAETLTCKYEGSRNGRLINISALRIAMAHFEPALVLTANVTNYHMRRAYPSTPGQRPGLWDLYAIARASIALIAYRTRRGGRGRSRPAVPDTLTSQYQFISAYS